MSTYTQLRFHIVFSTRNRAPLLTEDWRPRLHEFLGGIVRRERGVLLAAGGVEDHIHLFISTKPDVTLSDLVRDLKSNSTNWIHDEIQGQSGFAWQNGYSAFSVSMSQSREVEKYLARQRQHHQKTSFRDELIKFLRANEVEFNEEYLQ